jgi:hypothetical protein
MMEQENDYRRNGNTTQPGSSRSRTSIALEYCSSLYYRAHGRHAYRWDGIGSLLLTEHKRLV